METATVIVKREESTIKYESPYSTASPVYDGKSPSLKRRLSDMATEVRDNDEKRQRIDVPVDNDELDLASIIAQATATAEKTFTDATMRDATYLKPDSTIHSSITGQADNGIDAQQTFGLTSGFSSDPQLYMRILSLPMLESLSTQILSTLAQGPYSETIRIITQPESELGQAYATLKSLFDQTKKIYSQQKPFLSADELGISEPEHRSTIRTTNLATFVSSVFGGQDVGFYELNDHFVETFVPDGEVVQRDQGLLYLNLKTQMYLSAISQEEQEMAREEILDDLFPVGLEEMLLARHPETPLAPSEVEFIDEAKARREYLQNEPSDVDSISALSERYAWEDFLRSLSSHLKTAYEPLIAPYMRRHALTAPPVTIQTNAVGVDQQDGDYKEDTQDTDFDGLDLIEQATQAATQAALQSVGYGTYNGQTQDGAQHGQSGQQFSYVSQYSAGSVPYHTQTAPTQVLYEQARQAAVAKASPHSRRPGLPSQRRPWSTEEENALMAGLDQVKGPHWSQILALYGANGSISEILKDRNQVQLKDKARNLKLFFLKSNIEVPYYLQCVTGELKTRAPSQAARKEAEERAKLAGDEEQARFNGIMALASGMQQHSQPNADPPGVPGGISRDSRRESLQVVDDIPKEELVAESHMSSDDSLGARLKESIEHSDSAIVGPISS